jgi:hypothetical protein
MIDNPALVLTGIGLAASIIYYANILNNANKTRELQLKAQENSLKARQGQLIQTYILETIEKKSLDYQVDHLLSAYWSSFEEWVEKYWKDPEYQKAFIWIQVAMNGMGTCVSEGILDIRIVALFNADGIIHYWEKHKDIIYEQRRRRNSPRYCDMWEYVYTELKRYIEIHPELKP